MTDAKEKTIGETLVTVGLPIVFGLIAPTISRALSGGSAPEVVASVIVNASFAAATHVVEERHGGKVSPLLVKALQIEDIAESLDTLAPITSAHLRIEVAELRRKAAAIAPTDPAPTRDDEPTRREP